MRTGFIADVRLWLLAGIGLVAYAAGGLADQREPPISFEELASRGVQGRLGLPLGTIVEISGTNIANTLKDKSSSSWPYLLRIETINGNVLREPVLFFPVDLDRSKQAASPRIGDRFRWIAYETGQYSGVPDKLFNYVPAYADKGFGFETRLSVVVTKK